MHKFDIRHSDTADMPSIERLYPAAFPDEDLLPLVRHLLTHEPGILSLVAQAENSGSGQPVTGHILFTLSSISGSDIRAALLAPLAVAPHCQRQGIGTALIRKGLQDLASSGIDQVYVLGDPAYYSRHGFRPETAVTPPYPLPEEYRDAWQSLSLSTGQPPIDGKLLLPDIWMQPALWGP